MHAVVHGQNRKTRRRHGEVEKVNVVIDLNLHGGDG